MKNLFFATLIALGTSSAFASVQDNYRTCSQDQNWYNNFGRYVVAFDYSGAQAACRSEYHGGPGRVEAARCNVNGHWVTAGYYCGIEAGGPN